ncbi:MAG: hypothetical protein PHY78_15285 [Desulfobacterales bacterium]|nr:hypothetical protein [Desulfobacterales bacterium]
MARRKIYETPESGRKAVSLDKKQLKMFKIISIAFEMPEDEILKLSVDLLIHRFNKLTTEEKDRGIESLFE